MNRNIRPCYSLTNRKQDGGTKGDRHRKHKNPGKWKLSQRGGVATKELKTKCKVQIHENTRDKKLRMRCRWSEAGKGQETDHLNKNLMWWIWKQVQECLFSYSLCQSSSAPPGCVCWQTGSSSKIPAAPPRIRKTNRSHSVSLRSRDRDGGDVRQHGTFLNRDRPPSPRPPSSGSSSVSQGFETFPAGPGSAPGSGTAGSETCAAQRKSGDTGSKGIKQRETIRTD